MVQNVGPFVRATDTQCIVDLDRMCACQCSTSKAMAETCNVRSYGNGIDLADKIKDRRIGWYHEFMKGKQSEEHV